MIRGGESDCDKAAEEVSTARTEKRWTALQKRTLLVTPGERVSARSVRDWAVVKAGGGIERAVF